VYSDTSLIAKGQDPGADIPIYFSRDDVKILSVPARSLNLNTPQFSSWKISFGSSICCPDKCEQRCLDTSQRAIFDIQPLISFMRHGDPY
jgi:hypothetical protein